MSTVGGNRHAEKCTSGFAGLRSPALDIHEHALVAQTIKVGGAGSGLAVCTPIFERHVGKVWIESEPGKGAAFFFVLAA